MVITQISTLKYKFDNRLKVTSNYTDKLHLHVRYLKPISHCDLALPRVENSIKTQNCRPLRFQ